VDDVGRIGIGEQSEEPHQEKEMLLVAAKFLLLIVVFYTIMWAASRFVLWVICGPERPD
jgi:hypothetical protein